MNLAAVHRRAAGRERAGQDMRDVDDSDAFEGSGHGVLPGDLQRGQTRPLDDLSIRTKISAKNGCIAVRSAFVPAPDRRVWSPLTSRLRIMCPDYVFGRRAVSSFTFRMTSRRRV